MLVALASVWALGVLAIWPHAWTWDDFTDRARFDPWIMLFAWVWPLAGLTLAAAVVVDELVRPAERLPQVVRARPLRRHGRAVTWQS